MERRDWLAAFLFVVIAAIVYAASLAAYGDIVRDGRYTVREDGGEVISQHNELHKAIESAQAWSAENGGETAYIDPPAYRVTEDDDEQPVEPPIVVDPIEPPTDDGWLARPPGADAVRLSNTADESDLAEALASGRDVLLRAGSAMMISRTIRIEHDGQMLGVYGIGDRPILIAADGSRDDRSMADVVGDRIQIVGVQMVGIDLGHALTVSARSDDFLLEDCKIEGFTTGIHFLGWTESDEVTIDDPVVHRCIFYDLQNAGAHRHTTGIYAEGTDSLLVRECVFNEIGTDEPTKFRRAIYIQNRSPDNGVGHNTPTTLDGNIFANCAAEAFQLRSGGVARGNLILRCPVESHATGPDSEFIGNVVMYGASGLYMYSMSHGTIVDNVFAYGQEADDGWTRQAIRVGSRSWTVERNESHRWVDTAGNWITDNSTIRPLPGVSESNRVTGSPDDGEDLDDLTARETLRPRGEWSGETRETLLRVKNAA